MKAWLMKTEPDVFGIDDLERVKVEPWTGVRNTWARKYMTEMQVGDPVLFYHSSCIPPGVAGLARVARTGVVDETQFDPASKYHDDAATPDKPVWWCVDVEFVEKLPRVVALDELRAEAGLAGMMVLRVPRLSVQPVTVEEYEIVVGMSRRPAREIVKVAMVKKKTKTKTKKRARARARRKR